MQAASLIRSPGADTGCDPNQPAGSRVGARDDILVEPAEHVAEEAAEPAAAPLGGWTVAPALALRAVLDRRRPPASRTNPRVPAFRGPFVATGNGYFGTWLGFACALAFAWQEFY